MSMMDKIFRKKEKEQPAASKTTQSSTPAAPAARPAARPQGPSAAATAGSTPASRSSQGSGGGNVERWRRSGKPQAWVEKHNYQWNHEEWLQLLRDLERSEFWPMKPEEVGAVLEALKAEHARLETVGS